MTHDTTIGPGTLLTRDEWRLVECNDRGDLITMAEDWEDAARRIETFHPADPDEPHFFNFAVFGYAKFSTTEAILFCHLMAAARPDVTLVDIDTDLIEYGRPSAAA